MKIKRDIHYAWFVMIGCTLVIFYSIGLAINMFSIFLTPVINSLSLTKTQGASIMTAESITAVAAIVAAGWAYKRYRIRWLNLFCAVLMAAGFALLSVASTLEICYVAACCIGFGQGAGSIIPVSILLTNWFATNRGLALGIATTSSGFANIIFAPLIDWIIQTYGLTAAFLFQSISIILLAIAATFLIRDCPACMSCSAYGAGEEGSNSFIKDDLTECGANDINDTKDKKDENTLKAMFHSKEYWALCFVVFIIGVTLVPTNNHLPAFLISLGHSSGFAAFIFSLFGFSMIIGKITYGRISDKYGSFKANTYIYTMWIAALISTFLVEKLDFAPYLFGVLLGLGNPIGTMSLPIWTCELFGTQNYVQTYTSIKIFLTVGISVGYTIVGFLADRTGTYTSSFGLFAVLLVIGYSTLQLTYYKHKNLKDKKLGKV